MINKSVHSFAWFILFTIFLSLYSCSPIKPVTILPTVTKIYPTSTNIPETPTPLPQQNVEIPEDDKFNNKITIEFWHPWSGEAAQVIGSLIDEFNSSNIGRIQVNANSYGDEDYLTGKVLDALRNHQNPEIIAAPINFLRNLFLEGNGMVDLTAYVDHLKWGLTEEEKLSYPLAFWQQDTLNGARFGMPAERDVHVLFYNQSWAKELGFKSPPATPDDFLNQSCAAARANSYDEDPNNNGTGGWIYNSNPLTILSWMKAFDGGELPKAEGDQYVFNNKPNVDAYTFLQQIYKLGCAWIGKDPDPYQYFKTRKALFYSGTLQDILLQEKNSSKDHWIIIAYPSIDHNEVILTDGLSYGVLNTSSENNLAAWLFIRWMQKTDNQVKLIIDTGTYYLTSSTLEKMSSFRNLHPAWFAALQYLPLAKSTPLLSSWTIVGKILQDSTWQLAQGNVKTGDIPDVLSDVDKLIKEIYPK